MIEILTVVWWCMHPEMSPAPCQRPPWMQPAPTKKLPRKKLRTVLTEHEGKP